MTDIQPLQLVPMPTSGSYDDLPQSNYPYFIATKDDGYFLSKNTLFGKVILPYKAPDNLGTPKEYKTGLITFSDIKFPGYVIAQAVDFFTKVFNKWHTEAALIITYNPAATPTWRCFVPEQYVSGAGVSQKYNTEHIAQGWTAVGSIHSHCDFGAFHSGTDTHDADEFDGMHITIGMLTKPNGPEFASMISSNKIHFNITTEQAVNFGDMAGPTTSPDWWMRHVHAGQHAPWETKVAQRHPNWDHWTGHNTNVSTGYQAKYDKDDASTTYIIKLDHELETVPGVGQRIRKTTAVLRRYRETPRMDYTYPVTLPSEPWNNMTWEQWWKTVHGITATGKFPVINPGPTPPPNTNTALTKPDELWKPNDSTNVTQNNNANDLNRMKSYQEWWDTLPDLGVITSMTTRDLADLVNPDNGADDHDWGDLLDLDPAMLMQVAREDLANTKEMLRESGFELTWAITPLKERMN